MGETIEDIAAELERRSIRADRVFAIGEWMRALAARIRGAAQAWRPIQDAPPLDSGGLAVVTRDKRIVICGLRAVAIEPGKPLLLRTRDDWGDVNAGEPLVVGRYGQSGVAYLQAIGDHPVSWGSGICWKKHPRYVESDPPEWWIELPGGARR